MEPFSEKTVQNVVNPDGTVLTTQFTNPHEQSTTVEFQMLLEEQHITCGNVDVLQPINSNDKSDLLLDTGTFAQYHTS